METHRKINTIAIVGLQWGDEGKGKIVDCLAEQALHVARFQGGHNAGHTLIIGQNKYILHLIPSGILHPQCQCYIGNGVVIAPDSLIAEINLLNQQGISTQGRLWVAQNATLILPYHLALDAAREGVEGIGTTKRGIGPAHEDKVGRRAVRLYDLYNGNAPALIADNVSYYNHLLAYYNAPPLSADSIIANLDESAQQLAPYLCDDIGDKLQQAQQQGERIMLEGAQGSLLDIEQGTYPYVTSASCLVSASVSGLGVNLSPTPYGIIKSYSTRVGNGPFPTELQDEIGQKIGERGCEFGSTTQRQRRCGWLDIPLIRLTMRHNNCKNLIMTKMDVFDNFGTIKICTAYNLHGKTLSLPPTDRSQLSQCQPIYQEVEGWGQSAGCQNMADLPPAAQNFIAQVEQLCGATIDILSTGADRNDIIYRRPAFASIE